MTNKELAEFIISGELYKPADDAFHIATKYLELEAMAVGIAPEAGDTEKVNALLDFIKHDPAIDTGEK